MCFARNRIALHGVATTSAIGLVSSRLPPNLPPYLSQFLQTPDPVTPPGGVRVLPIIGLTRYGLFQVRDSVPPAEPYPLPLSVPTDLRRKTVPMDCVAKLRRTMRSESDRSRSRALIKGANRATSLIHGFLATLASFARHAHSPPGVFSDVTSRIFLARFNVRQAIPASSAASFTCLLSIGPS